MGVYATGVFDRSTAEIPAYDPASQRLFVVNATRGVDVLDLADPTRPRFVTTLGRAGVNSVAVHGGRVALAMEGPTVDGPGVVTVYAAPTGEPLAEVATGPQPDMLCFSPDGRVLAVANEAEPRAGRDAVGGITLIDTQLYTARTFSFGAAIRRFGTNELRVDPRYAGEPERGLEPEYLVFTPDGRFLVVGLQENNAIALVDVTAGAVTGFCGLGAVDHAVAGAGLDASDLDGGVQIVNAPVRGLRQPDTIALHTDGDRLYLLTANEGDPRADASDVARVADLALDPGVFPAAEGWAAPERLGRLNVSTVDGDPDGDGDRDALYAFGGRSFSVFELTPAGTGPGPGTPRVSLRFDSGDAFERLTASLLPTGFNASNEATDSGDSRSDDRGPEPEGLALGKVNGRPYVFVGLERPGGVVAYDLTNPHAPSLAAYVNLRDFSQPVQDRDGRPNPAAGDLGPEGLTFISAADSPTGEPLLIVANEVSGTTRIYAVGPAVPVTAPDAIAPAPGDPR